MTRRRHTVLLIAIYLVAYLTASGLDHWTTALALERPGATEGNAFAKSSDAFAPTQAVVLTAVGALIMVGCIIFSSVHANRVLPVFLQHPVPSFRKLYVLPWSPAAIDRSPLHMLSWALALVPLRLLAAGNNLLIAHYGIAPIGSLVKRLSAHTSPVIGVLAVVGTIYVLLALALSPLAARALVSLRSAPKPQGHATVA